MTVTAAAPHTGPIVESAAAAQGPAGAASVAGSSATRELLWRSEADTAAFARRLAAQPQIANAYLELHGDLGVGKTTLVRHLLRALGVQGRIKSPSYALAEAHQAPQLAHTIWHLDFYRFDDPREWEDAGLRDLFSAPGLKLAEWPQKAAALAPPADLAIHMQATEDGTRRVTLRAQGATGRALLSGL